MVYGETKEIYFMLENGKTSAIILNENEAKDYMWKTGCGVKKVEIDLGLIVQDMLDVGFLLDGLKLVRNSAETLVCDTMKNDSEDNSDLIFEFIFKKDRMYEACEGSNKRIDTITFIANVNNTIMLTRRFDYGRNGCNSGWKSAELSEEEVLKCIKTMRRINVMFKEKIKQEI